MTFLATQDNVMPVQLGHTDQNGSKCYLVLLDFSPEPFIYFEKLSKFKALDHITIVNHCRNCLR